MSLGVVQRAVERPPRAIPPVQADDYLGVRRFFAERGTRAPLPKEQEPRAPYNRKWNIGAAALGANLPYSLPGSLRVDFPALVIAALQTRSWRALSLSLSASLTLLFSGRPFFSPSAAATTTQRVSLSSLDRKNNWKRASRDKREKKRARPGCRPENDNHMGTDGSGTGSVWRRPSSVREYRGCRVREGRGNSSGSIGVARGHPCAMRGGVGHGCGVDGFSSSGSKGEESRRFADLRSLFLRVIYFRCFHVDLLFLLRTIKRIIYISFKFN